MEIDSPDRLETLRGQFEKENINLQKRISEYISYKETKKEGILSYFNPSNYQQPPSSDDVFSKLDIRYDIIVDPNSLSTAYDVNPKKIVYPQRVDRGEMDKPSSAPEGTFEYYYHDALVFMLIYESNIRYLFWVLSDEFVNTDEKCLHAKELITMLLKYTSIKSELDTIRVSDNDRKKRLYLLFDSLHNLVKSHIEAFKQNIGKLQSVCVGNNMITKANHIIKIIDTKKKPSSSAILWKLLSVFSSNASENSSVLQKYEKTDNSPSLSDQLSLETYGPIKLNMDEDKQVLTNKLPKIEYPQSITNKLSSPDTFNGIEKEIEEKYRQIFISEEKMRFILSVIATDDIRMEIKCAYALDFQDVLSRYYLELPSIVDMLDQHEYLKNSKYSDILAFLESQIDTHLLQFSEISKNLDFLCIQSNISKNQSVMDRLAMDKSGKSMLYYTALENVISDLSTLHLKLSNDVKIILSNSSEDKYDTCQKALKDIDDYDISLQENIYNDTLEKIRYMVGNYQVTSIMDDMSIRVLDAFTSLEESMKLIRDRCNSIQKPPSNDDNDNEEKINAMFEKIDIVPKNVFRNGRIVRRRGDPTPVENDFVPCDSEENCIERIIDEHKKLDKEQDMVYEESIKKTLEKYLTTANYYINLEKKIDALKTEIRSHIRGLVSNEVILGKRKSPPQGGRKKKPTSTYKNDEDLEKILLELDVDLDNAISKSENKKDSVDDSMNVDDGQVDKDEEIKIKIQKANDKLFQMKLDRSINGVKDINNTRKYNIVNNKGSGYLYLYKSLVKMASYRKQYKKSDDKEISMEMGIIKMLDIRGEYKPDVDRDPDDDGDDDVSPPVVSGNKTRRLTRSG